MPSGTSPRGWGTKIPLTNWTGDDGFLKRLRVQLRRPHYLADTLWLRGQITEKYRDGDQLLVDCQLSGQNQRAETVSQAWATGALPGKSNLPQP